MTAIAPSLWMNWSFWGEQCAVLVAGSTAIWLVAALLARQSSSARWQRGCWQAATLGLLAVFACELVGAGGLAVAVGRNWIESTTTTTLIATSDKSSSTDSRNALQSVQHSDDVDDECWADDTVASIAQPPLAWGDMQAEFAADDFEHSATITAPAIPPAQSSDTDQGDDAITKATRWPLVLWLCGSLFCLIRWTNGWWRLRRLVQAARPADAELCARTQALAARLGLRQRVRLLVMPGLNGPVAFGIWRPTIGLPVGFARQFNRQEQEAIVAHELAHLAGRDPAWRLLAGVTAAVSWWQPAAWSARSRLEAACENVADEASLVLADGPQTLAACLVELGKQLLRPRKLGWSGIEGGGFKSGLGRRVTRLLNLQGRAWRATRGGWLIVGTAASLLALASLAGTAWARRTTWESKGENMTIGQAWRRSLGGLALLAALGSGGNPAGADDKDTPVPPPPVDRPAPPPPPGGDRRPEGRPPEPRREEDRDGRLDRLKKDARRLREEGKIEDAARVEKEFREQLQGMLKHMLPQLPEEVRGKLMPKIEEYFKARDDGKFADADRIEEEAKAIMKPFEDKLIEPQAKLRHIRGAADNLKAAGMHDLAEKLYEQVRAMEKELGLPPMPEGQPRPRDGGPEGPPRPEGDRRRPEGDRRGPDAGRRGPEGERRGPEGDRGRERGDDRRGPEGEGRRGPEGDRRGPEGRGPEGDRRPEGRGPDANRRGPDGDRGPEGRGPEGDRRGPDGRGPDARGDRRDGDRPRDGERREGDRPRDGDRREGDRPRDGGDAQQDLARIIRQLREELDSLRREVQELRGKPKP